MKKALLIFIPVLILTCISYWYVFSGGFNGGNAPPYLLEIENIDWTTGITGRDSE